MNKINNRHCHWLYARTQDRNRKNTTIPYTYKSRWSRTTSNRNRTLLPRCIAKTWNNQKNRTSSTRFWTLNQPTRNVVIERSMIRNKENTTQPRSFNSTERNQMICFKCECMGYTSSQCQNFRAPAQPSKSPPRINNIWEENKYELTPQ